MEDRQRTKGGSPTQRFTELAQTSGAMLTVLVALTFILIISVVALLKASDNDVATVAGAAFTGIGTIAGGYTGVRIGAHGKERSDRVARESQLVLERVAEKGEDGQVKQAREEVREDLSAGARRPRADH